MFGFTTTIDATATYGATHRCHLPAFSSLLQVNLRTSWRLDRCYLQHVASNLLPCVGSKRCWLPRSPPSGPSRASASPTSPNSSVCAVWRGPGADRRGGVETGRRQLLAVDLVVLASAFACLRPPSWWAREDAVGVGEGEWSAQYVRAVVADGGGRVPVPATYTSPALRGRQRRGSKARSRAPRGPPPDCRSAGASRARPTAPGPR